MSKTAESRNVIRAQSVRTVSQPVMIECGDGVNHQADSALSVLPLMDGHTVAGVEVRCSCGSSVVIECLYEEGAGAIEG